VLFLTFSRYRRQSYLGTAIARDRFEAALERTRQRYRLQVIGYVVMPEHVHLLLTEPSRASLARALQSLKISVARRSRENPFWQARYYDFSVFTESKRIGKLEYMHANPIRRGLVETAEAWRWSSARFYLSGETGKVQIESEWTMHWKST
jgi:putative transposase